MTFANIFKSTLGTAAVAGLALVLTPNPAAAATATTTFTVSASVTATCLVSATTMAFGNYAFAATPSTSTISVTCTNGTTYNVGLNAGLTGTVTARQMAGTVAGSVLNYGLFTDSGHATNWGNTVGTDTVAGTGSGAAQALTVYGQIPATQYVAPGSYSDTITATVTY